MQYFIATEIALTAPLTDPASDYVARIGHYNLNDDGTVTSHYWLYSSKQDLPAAYATVRNPNVTHSPNTPGFIQVTHYSQEAAPSGTWSLVGDTLTIVLGTNTHVRNRQAGGNFKLTTPWTGTCASATAIWPSG